MTNVWVSNLIAVLQTKLSAPKFFTNFSNVAAHPVIVCFANLSCKYMAVYCEFKFSFTKTFSNKKET